jgi:threonine dehydratase
LPDVFITNRTDVYTNSNKIDYLRLSLTSRVYEGAIETPLQYATNLSKKLKNNILLKREDLQPVFSFKIRGAFNKVAHLEVDQLKKGIVCCSAGNHAQGVAMAASRMKVNAKIVMPIATPNIKLFDSLFYKGGICKTTWW